MILHQHSFTTWISAAFFLISCLGGITSCQTARDKAPVSDQEPADVVRMHLESVRVGNPAAANTQWEAPPMAGEDNARPCDRRIKKFLVVNPSWRIIETIFEKKGVARVSVHFEEPDLKKLVSTILQRHIATASREKSPVSLEERLCDITASELALIRPRGEPPIPRKTSTRWFHLEKRDERWRVVARTETPTTP